MVHPPVASALLNLCFHALFDKVCALLGSGQLLMFRMLGSVGKDMLRVWLRFLLNRQLLSLVKNFSLSEAELICCWLAPKFVQWFCFFFTIKIYFQRFFRFFATNSKGWLIGYVDTCVWSFVKRWELVCFAFYFFSRSRRKAKLDLPDCIRPIHKVVGVNLLRTSFNPKFYSVILIFGRKKTARRCK